MTTVAIVQARMRSSRLPGKVLMDLAGRSVLWHVLTRCAASDEVDLVCCATTGSEADEPVVDEAHAAGAVVFRGAEADVLDRYHQAALETGAEVVLRVTSDCPFIDPEVAAEVLRLRRAEGADLAVNNAPPSWPHGLDCEAMTAEALALAARHRDEVPGAREHVTIWLRRDPRIRKANLAGPGGALAEQRWTVDYPEDMAFLRAVTERLPAPPHVAGWREIAAVLEAHPALLDINRARRAEGRAAAPVGEGA